MSTATYPQGMKSYNNNLPQGGYKTWKGRGINSNPIGITPTHIRPLTNNDPGNIFPTGFGLPRPIKHYRKGRHIPTYTNIPNNISAAKQINYNLNRSVKSSLNTSLGGGGGGGGLIADIIDMPGQVNIKENTNIDSDRKDGGISRDCEICNGVGVVSGWYPIENLTNKPDTIVTSNKEFCCNQQKKAIQKVLPTNTNISKKYFQTTKAYLQNRCQTFKQRSFNFVNGRDPVTGQQLYVAQCSHTCFNDDNTKPCGQVYYKPNNEQFASQGAVSSSTRLLKLNVDTITSAAAQTNKLKGLNSAQALVNGGGPTTPFIYKEKTPKCNPATYIGNPFFFRGHPPSKTICNHKPVTI
jgi:hypothetical protein